MDILSEHIVNFKLPLAIDAFAYNNKTVHFYTLSKYLRKWRLL